MSGQVRGLIFEVQLSAVSCQLSVEGELMQFEVNNQMYVVNFVPEEGRWYVLAPTDTGVVRIPVEVDEPFYDTFGFPQEDKKRDVVN
jgi:hypothetical protein